ncbi:unnamed protein product [Lupinus luteus]|uniref:Uncharacterized protein n=1 Tax=Lupinus luteus TaxID=3873 RepID=A0AAV1VXM0_LUPLU
MQKKLIQLQPITQQEAPKHLVQENESNPEKNKEVISSHDPKSTFRNSENVEHDTSNISKAREESIPQKGQEGHDPKSKVENKEHDTPNLPKGTKETMPPMVQEVEINEESKESSKDEESFVDPKPTNTKKRKLNFDHEADEKSIPESTVKRIKEVAASASETSKYVKLYELHHHGLSPWLSQGKFRSSKYRDIKAIAFDNKSTTNVLDK